MLSKYVGFFCPFWALFTDIDWKIMNVKSTIFKKKKKLSKFDESIDLSVVPNNNNNNNFICTQHITIQINDMN